MFSTDKPTIEEARGEHHTADIALCQRVSDDLTKHYPGHPWAIGADHEAGCLWIHLAYPDNRAAQAEEIRGPEFGIPGYLLHTGKLQNKYDFNKVMIFNILYSGSSTSNDDKIDCLYKLLESSLA